MMEVHLKEKVGIEETLYTEQIQEEGIRTVSYQRFENGYAP